MWEKIRAFWSKAKPVLFNHEYVELKQDGFVYSYRYGLKSTDFQLSWSDIEVINAFVRANAFNDLYLQFVTADGQEHAIVEDTKNFQGLSDEIVRRFPCISPDWQKIPVRDWEKLIQLYPAEQTIANSPD